MMTTTMTMTVFFRTSFFYYCCFIFVVLLLQCSSVPRLVIVVVDAFTSNKNTILSTRYTTTEFDFSSSFHQQQQQYYYYYLPTAGGLSQNQQSPLQKTTQQSYLHSIRSSSSSNCEKKKFCSNSLYNTLQRVNNQNEYQYQNDNVNNNRLYQVGFSIPNKLNYKKQQYHGTDFFQLSFQKTPLEQQLQSSSSSSSCPIDLHDSLRKNVVPYFSVATTTITTSLLAVSSSYQSSSSSDNNNNNNNKMKGSRDNMINNDLNDTTITTTTSASAAAVEEKWIEESFNSHGPDEMIQSYTTGKTDINSIVVEDPLVKDKGNDPMKTINIKKRNDNTDRVSATVSIIKENQLGSIIANDGPFKVKQPIETKILPEVQSVSTSSDKKGVTSTNTQQQLLKKNSVVVVATMEENDDDDDDLFRAIIKQSISEVYGNKQSKSNSDKNVDLDSLFSSIVNDDDNNKLLTTTTGTSNKDSISKTTKIQDLFSPIVTDQTVSNTQDRINQNDINNYVPSIEKMFGWLSSTQEQVQPKSKEEVDDKDHIPDRRTTTTTQSSTSSIPNGNNSKNIGNIKSKRTTFSTSRSQQDSRQPRYMTVQKDNVDDEKDTTTTTTISSPTTSFDSSGNTDGGESGISSFFLFDFFKKKDEPNYFPFTSSTNEEKTTGFFSTLVRPLESLFEKRVPATVFDTDDVDDESFSQLKPLAKEGTWNAYLDFSSGLVFYFNTITKKSQWNPPTSTFPIPETKKVDDTNSNPMNRLMTLELASVGDWSAYLDDKTFLVYYFNNANGQSQWDKPSKDFPTITSDQILAAASIITPEPIYTDSETMWSAYQDFETKKIYYYDGTTGLSQWNKPYPTFPQITLDGMVQFDNVIDNIQYYVQETITSLLFNNKSNRQNFDTRTKKDTKSFMKESSTDKSFAVPVKESNKNLDNTFQIPSFFVPGNKREIEEDMEKNNDTVFGSFFNTFGVGTSTQGSDNLKEKTVTAETLPVKKDSPNSIGWIDNLLRSEILPVTSSAMDDKTKITTSIEGKEEGKNDWFTFPFFDQKPVTAELQETTSVSLKNEDKVGWFDGLLSSFDVSDKTLPGTKQVPTVINSKDTTKPSNNVFATLFNKGLNTDDTPVTDPKKNPTVLVKDTDWVSSVFSAFQLTKESDAKQVKKSSSKQLERKEKSDEKVDNIFSKLYDDNKFSFLGKVEKEVTVQNTSASSKEKSFSLDSLVAPGKSFLSDFDLVFPGSAAELGTRITKSLPDVGKLMNSVIRGNQKTAKEIFRVKTNPTPMRSGTTVIKKTKNVSTRPKIDEKEMYTKTTPGSKGLPSKLSSQSTTNSNQRKNAIDFSFTKGNQVRSTNMIMEKKGVAATSVPKSTFGKVSGSSQIKASEFSVTKETSSFGRGTSIGRVMTIVKKVVTPVSNRQGLYQPTRNIKVSRLSENVKLAFEKKVPLLYEWKQNADGSITGLIANSKQYKTGTQITTSSIKSSASPGAVVTTKSGSKYLLFR